MKNFFATIVLASCVCPAVARTPLQGVIANIRMTMNDGVIAEEPAVMQAAASVTQAQAVLARHRHRPHPRPQVPPSCESRPVIELVGGHLYQAGREIAQDVQSFKDSCGGDLAWVDRHSSLFKNGSYLGSARQYRMSFQTGDVLWENTSGIWSIDGGVLGRLQKYDFVEFTGDVVWVDLDGYLHKNQQPLGDEPVDLFVVATQTGDVAWRDHHGYLFKNAQQIGRFAVSFSIWPDGRIVWTDHYGYEHAN